MPPAASAPDSATLKARLERRATFEAALKELTSAVAQPASQQQPAAAAPPPQPLLLELVPRVHTLLKARYSNPALWGAGLELFRAVQASGHAPPALQAKLPGFLKDAEAFMNEGLDAGDDEQPRQQTLGELLLGLPPPRPTPSHLSDAGLVLDHPTPLPQAAAAVAAMREPPQQPPQQQLEGGADAAADASEQQQQPGAEPEQDAESVAAMLQESLLQADGPNRAELEAMLLSMVEQQTAAQPLSNRPAASKRAVASLPVLALDSAAALEGVGGPTTKCPVCTEELCVGDSVQQLPCKHVFHVDCLKPWLEKDNSCPVCRQELPTDDHRYEARKEREAQEAEDRRGADNALSHNEMMYI